MRHQLAGQKFGRLTVGQRSLPGKWECTCDCGRVVHVGSHRLVSGDTRSCGCLLREVSAIRRTTHGKSSTKEYFTWQRMIRRCTKPDHPDYPDYGGRGIRVCDRWMAGFPAFHEDMGDAPSGDHSIDRIDVNGGYEPGNCRWATASQQANNRTTSRLVTHQGRTMTMMEWATELGINYHTLIGRVERFGMTIDEAFARPIEKASTFTYDGMTLNAREWSELTGIPYQTIITRINKLGWSIQKALTVPNGKYVGRKARSHARNDGFGE